MEKNWKQKFVEHHAKVFIFLKRHFVTGYGKDPSLTKKPTCNYAKKPRKFVTASSGTAISTDMFRNFVKNSFKFDVALKHAQDEVPARKSTPEKQKSPLATNKQRRRLKRRPQRIQNTVLCQSLGDIHYYSKGNQCSRCSPEYLCGILCGN